jgi:hypothetical protein
MKYEYLRDVRRHGDYEKERAGDNAIIESQPKRVFTPPWFISKTATAQECSELSDIFDELWYCTKLTLGSAIEMLS